MSKIWSALVGQNIRVYLGDTTEMVQEAVRLHQTNEVSSRALSRTLTATSLLGKLLKNDKDVLTLKVTGTNQIKGILATADFTGRVKGYISNPSADLSFKSTNAKIGEAIGLGGQITVIRDFGLKEPYVGISHMITAEIDDDIAFYFKHSEQQKTALKLDTVFDGNRVIKSGGILIQPLPYATPKELAAFELSKEKIHNVATLLAEGLSPEAIIQSYFGDLDVRITGEFPVEFKCDCSLERITRALLTVGKEELIEMKEVDKQAEIQCHFCMKHYRFNEEDLQEMIDALDA